jgi:hypothetical protein
LIEPQRASARYFDAERKDKPPLRFTTTARILLVGLLAAAVGGDLGDGANVGGPHRRRSVRG